MIILTDLFFLLLRIAVSTTFWVMLCLAILAAIIFSHFYPQKLEAGIQKWNIRCFSGGKMIYAASSVEDAVQYGSGIRFTLNAPGRPTVGVTGMCLLEEI